MPFTRAQWDRWKKEHPKEWKKRAEKIAASHRGSKLSPAHRAAIAAAMKGKKKSREQKRKIAESVRRAHIRPRIMSPSRFRLPRFHRPSGLPRFGSFLPVLLTLAVVVPLLIVGLTNFGLTIQPDWSLHWESMKEVKADNREEWVTTQLVFGAFRPVQCIDGIEVRDEENSNVSFELTNEVYRDGVCAETEVRFKNIVYQEPIPFGIEFIEPTPQDGATIPDNAFVVNVTVTEPVVSAFLVVDGEKHSETVPMSGLDNSWWFTETILQNESVTFRVLVTDIHGKIIDSESRTVRSYMQESLNESETNGEEQVFENNTADLINEVGLVNETAPAEESADNVMSGGIGPEANETEGNYTIPTGSAITPPMMTYRIYWGRKPVTELSNVELIDPTPADNDIVYGNWVGVNAHMDAYAVLVLLEWTGPEDSTEMIQMNGEAKEWNYNMTGLSDGIYSFRVFATDAKNHTVASEQRTVHVVHEAINVTAEGTSGISFDQETYYVPPGALFTATIKVKNPTNSAKKLTLAPAFDDRLKIVKAEKVEKIQEQEPPTGAAVGRNKTQGKPEQRLTALKEVKQKNVESIKEYSKLDKKLKKPEDFIAPVFESDFKANEEQEFIVTFRMPNATGKGEIFFYALGDNVSLAVDPWWDSNWAYERDIVVTEISGNSFPHYTVGVSMDTQSLISNSKLESDCDDLRFVDRSGNQLNYWIEGGCSNAVGVDSNIWLRVRSLEAYETKYISVYYGNPSAPAFSNGDNTFDFFDHFDCGGPGQCAIDASKWGSNGTVQQQDSIVTVTGASSNGGEMFSMKSFQPQDASGGLGINAVWNASSSVDVSGNYIYWGMSDALVNNYLFVTTDHGYEAAIGGSPAWVGRSYGATSYHIWDMQWNDTSNFYTDRAYENSISNVYTPTSAINVYAGAYTDSTTFQADWVFGRQYVTPEPTVSKWNNSETGTPSSQADYSPCAEDSECTSGYCRVTPTGYKYCAPDSTSCVMEMRGIITAVPSESEFLHKSSFAGADRPMCYNGWWSRDPLLTSFNSTYANYTFNTYPSSHDASVDIRVPLNALVVKARAKLMGYKNNNLYPLGPTIDMDNHLQTDWGLRTPVYLDRQCIVGQVPITYTVSDNYWVAQSITVPDSALAIVGVYLSSPNPGPGNNITVEIRTDDSSNPGQPANSNHIIASKTFAMNAFYPNVDTWVKVTIPARLEYNSTYWMVIRGTLSTGDADVHYNINNCPAGGTGLLGDLKTSEDGGSSWGYFTVGSGRELVHSVYLASNLTEWNSPDDASLLSYLGGALEGGTTVDTYWRDVPINISSGPGKVTIADLDVQYVGQLGDPCNDDRDCRWGFCRDDYDGSKFCTDTSSRCVNDSIIYESQGIMPTDYAISSGAKWCYNGRWGMDPFKVPANSTYQTLWFRTPGWNSSTTISVDNSVTVSSASMKVTGKANLTMVNKIWDSLANTPYFVMSDAGYVYVGHKTNVPIQLNSQIEVYNKTDWRLVATLTSYNQGTPKLTLDDNYIYFSDGWSTYVNVSNKSSLGGNWISLGPVPSFITALENDWNYLYIGTINPSVEVVRKSDWKTVASLTMYDGSNPASLAQDENYLYVGSAFGNVTVFYKNTWEPAKFFAPTTSCGALGCSVEDMDADYKWLLVSDLDGGSGRVSKESWTTDSFSTAASKAITMDNKYFYVGTDDNVVQLFDVEDAVANYNPMNITEAADDIVSVWRDRYDDYLYTVSGTSTEGAVRVYSWVYPNNTKIDIGLEGLDWSYNATLNQSVSPQTVDFTSELQSLLGSCNCVGCSLQSGFCSIAINVSSGSTGIIDLEGLNITYASPPTLTSVSANVSYVKNGDGIRITTSGAADSDGDPLSLQCGDASGLSNLCTGDSGSPERTCDFASPWSDNAAHTVYCRVNDGALDSTPDVTVVVTADNTDPTCTVSGIFEGTNPNYQYNVSATSIYYNNRTTGTFDVNVTPSDAGSGVQKVNFPTTVSAGGDDTTDPFRLTYTWGTSSTYGGLSTATVYDSVGQTGTCTFTVTGDNTPPAGGSIAYINGYNTTPAVVITFTDGTDGESGLNASSALLERQEATRTGGACGAFGSWVMIGTMDPSSPYSDTNVQGAKCYMYRYNVSDYVANTVNYTSANTTMINAGPTLTSVSPNVSYVKNGDGIRITTSGAADSDGDPLSLQCGDASGLSNLCTGDSGSPERTCDFASPWSDNAAHTVYCRVNDGVLNPTPERTVVITSYIPIPPTAPTLEGVLVDDDVPFPYDLLDMLGGMQRVVICNGTVNDVNGGSEINTTFPTGVLFNNGGGTISSCTADNNNCYRNSTCVWKQRKNETAQYAECRFSPWFNARNSTGLGWTCNITVTDTTGLTGYGIDGTDVNPLLAVGLDSTVMFGTRSVGSNDTQVGTGCGASMYCRDNVTNYGNVQFDVLINGTSMTCVGGSGGTVNVGYLHVNYTDSALYSQSYFLTGTAIDSQSRFSGFDLAKNSTATTEAPRPTNKYTYWGIGVPIGVNGNCQGTIWFTAVAG